MTDTSLCPRYHKAIELVGRRWTGAIILTMLGKTVRYHELRQAVPEISDRMLAERLRELESEGMVARRVIPSSPVRVEYALTEKGQALQVALEAVGRWAEEWVQLDGTNVTQTASLIGEPERAPAA